MNIFSDNVIIVLGLMIPFLGILFPLLVLLLFQVSHPETPTAEDAQGRAAAPGHQPIPAYNPLPGRRIMTEEKGPIRIDSSELLWLRDRLREADVLEGLTDTELRYIAAIGHRRTVRAGERLAEGGSRGEALFVILKGDLQLLTHADPEVAVRTAHAGESVPLAVIIDPPVLVTTVEAASDGEVFVIPRRRLLDLMDKQQMIGFQIYRSATKLFEHRYRMTLYRGGSVTEGQDV